ncbi:RNA methyltransferase TrmH family protein [Dioscorea alata]|uniref:RNA methyltransferase TrmH family protein n=1 Tax=Dioscorea alata TaxID=55571 RepID=A0ACB7UN75_DIOAL|nr:RNA methyltransferase TrmH family protein [Dioscorea alata]
MQSLRLFAFSPPLPTHPAAWRDSLPSCNGSISSPSNPFVKHCVKLRLSSSYRHSSRSAIVVGLTPILEICKFRELWGSSLVDCLLLLDGSETPEGFRDSSARILHVSSHVMKKVSGLQSADSIEAVAIIKFPSSFLDLDGGKEDASCETWFPSPQRILVLDGIQDPGNLGTLLRSTMAFKWDGVFLLPGCCDPFNEKALRAARGASFQLPLVSGNWLHLETLGSRFHMKMLAGHPDNYSGKLEGSSLLSQELADSLAGMPLCMVLGSEGRGLSEKALQVCDLVSIPMVGMFESLNVSVAGGIFLFMLQPEHHR